MQSFYRTTMTLNNQHLAIEILKNHSQHTLRFLESIWDFTIHAVEHSKTFYQHWVHYQMQDWHTR